MSSDPTSRDPLLLAADLAAELSTVTHVQASLTATVAGEELTADSARDLRQILSGHLYNHWHTRLGADEDTGTRFYRDLDFESTLAAHTPVQTARRDAVLLRDAVTSTTAEPTEVIVVLDGVRVAVPTTSVLGRQGHEVAIAVPAARPSLSPGFWLVDGSHGRFRPGQAPLRVYVSIPVMASAPRIWESALTALEAGGHRYRAKVGSAARLYPRTDACVVYLDGDSLDGPGPGPVEALLEALPGDPGLGVATSAFTRTLIDGVAVAAEPVDPRPGMAGMSFGQHRCYAVATGIIDTSGGPDMAIRVHDALVTASIDPLDPARNLPPAAPADGGTDASDGGQQ